MPKITKEQLLLADIKEIKEISKETYEQAKATNGRVGTLEVLKEQTEKSIDKLEKSIKELSEENTKSKTRQGIFSGLKIAGSVIFAIILVIGGYVFQLVIRDVVREDIKDVVEYEVIKYLNKYNITIEE